jgi:hypothetical protein
MSKNLKIRSNIQLASMLGQKNKSWMTKNIPINNQKIF